MCVCVILFYIFSFFFEKKNSIFGCVFFTVHSFIRCSLFGFISRAYNTIPCFSFWFGLVQFFLLFCSFCIAHFLFNRLALTTNVSHLPRCVNTNTVAHTSYRNVFYTETFFYRTNRIKNIMWKRKTTRENDWYIFSIFLAWRRVTALIHDKCCPFRFNTCATISDAMLRFRSLAEKHFVLALAGKRFPLKTVYQRAVTIMSEQSVAVCTCTMDVIVCARAIQSVCVHVTVDARISNNTCDTLTHSPIHTNAIVQFRVLSSSLPLLLLSLSLSSSLSTHKQRDSNGATNV